MSKIGKVNLIESNKLNQNLKDHKNNFLSKIQIINYKIDPKFALVVTIRLIGFNWDYAAKQLISNFWAVLFLCSFYI